MTSSPNEHNEKTAIATRTSRAADFQPDPDETVTSSENSLATDHVGMALDYDTGSTSSSHDRPMQQSSTTAQESTTPPKDTDHPPTVSENQNVRALEERVMELETKLAAMCRLMELQDKNDRNIYNSATLTTTKTVPLPECDDSLPFVPGSLLDEEHRHPTETGTSTPPQQIEKSCIKTGDSSATVPHLESPAMFLGMDADLFDKTDPHSPVLKQEKSPTNNNNNNNNNNKSLDEQSSNQKIDDTFNEKGMDLKPLDPDLFTQPNTVKRRGRPSSSPSSTPTSSLRRRPISLMGRNLSFKLLYGGDEQVYQEQRHSDPNAQASMTPLERRWLGDFTLRTQQAIANHKMPQPRHIPDDKARNKWLNYLNSFQESTHDVDLQMEEFVKVPGHVESIMAFGFYICVDSFLYTLTILPIRFIWSLLLLIMRLGSMRRKSSSPFQFHRRHTYQLIQVSLIFVIYTYILVPISIGKLYHWIRGQAMIKLYVLIAIVEVFDRLMSSMGQDCLDSMYWNAVNRPRSSRMLISVAVVFIYAACHTYLLFLHVATLNVAMNSADQALLTLFISGNFAEIKSTVFKKYNKPALFKLTACDICERFKLGLFLGLVLLLNICQGMDQGQFVGYMRICAIVWCAELLADWVKHSFITKFNMLPAKVYIEYSLLLAGDFTGIGHEGVNLDHSHAVVKRIGFAQLPLICVTFRLLREAAKYAAINQYWPYLSRGAVAMVFATVWLCLLAMKLALGNLLQRISVQKLRHAPEILPSAEKKKKR